MERAWPLLARDVELAVVADAFARPDVAGAVLVGEEGVGLTALAHRVRQHLAAAGVRVEWVPAAVGVPARYGAIGHLMPGHPNGDAAAVVNAVVDRFAGLGGRSRVAVVVDDAHLLDGRCRSRREAA